MRHCSSHRSIVLRNSGWPTCERASQRPTRVRRSVTLRRKSLLTFTKTILFTDTDGVARFRDQEIALDQGSPQSMLTTLFASGGYQLRHSPLGFRSQFHCTGHHRSGCSSCVGRWRSACRTDHDACLVPETIFILPTYCRRARNFDAAGAWALEPPARPGSARDAVRARLIGCAAFGCSPPSDRGPSWQA